MLMVAKPLILHHFLRVSNQLHLQPPVLPHRPRFRGPIGGGVGGGLEGVGGLDQGGGGGKIRPRDLSTPLLLSLPSDFIFRLFAHFLHLRISSGVGVEMRLVHRADTVFLGILVFLG